MKPKNNLWLQITSFIIWVGYIITIFNPWFVAVGIRTINGEIIFTSLFPLAICLMLLYLITLLVCFFNSSRISVNYIGLTMLILELILSIRLFVIWGGFTSMITNYFYINNLLLLLAIVMEIFKIINKKRYINKVR